MTALRAVELDAGELAREAIDRGAVQNEQELTQLVRFLLGQPRPRRALEVGVMRGGTLWLWRQLASRARGSFVLGIDITPPGCDDCDNRRAHIGCPLRTVQRNVYDFGNGEARAEILIADSQRSATAELARKHSPDGFDLLHIDADHGPGVWRDFDLYSPLVNAAGIIVLHDVTLDRPEVWPPAALWQTLRGAPGAFTIDAGGFGFGVLVGNEYRAHIFDG